MVIEKFQNENITIEHPVTVDGQRMTNEELDRKYEEEEVRIVTEQARYPLPTINSLFKQGQYKMHPDFQRRQVWTLIQKSRLIESFIMNVPIAPIFLYEIDYSQYEVMDGLQRVTAISEFYDNKFSLTGLEVWSALNGKYYNDLPANIRKGIDRRYLSSIILLKETAKDKASAEKMKRIVFERINTGGTQLQAQESRNAYFKGGFLELCKDLSRDPYFCRIFDIPETEEENGEFLRDNYMYSRMKDVEAVIRFFAMRNLDDFNMPLQSFLDLFTEQANKLPNVVLEQYGQLFRDTIKLAYDIFGVRAFGVWRKRGDEWIFFDKPNMFLYDAIMTVLSQKLCIRDNLVARNANIEADIKALYQENEILREGRKGGKSNVLERINIFDEFFNRYE